MQRFNLEQNIARLFHVLAHFLFTIKEMKQDCYHQKVTPESECMSCLTSYQTNQTLGSYEMNKFQGNL